MIVPSCPFAIERTLTFTATPPALGSVITSLTAWPTPPARRVADRTAPSASILSKVIERAVPLPVDAEASACVLAVLPAVSPVPDMLISKLKATPLRIAATATVASPSPLPPVVARVATEYPEPKLVGDVANVATPPPPIEPCFNANPHSCPNVTSAKSPLYTVDAIFYPSLLCY